MDEELTQEEYNNLLKILINLGKGSNYRSVTGIWGELVTHSKENTNLIKHFMPRLEDLLVSLYSRNVSLAKHLGVSQPQLRRKVIHIIAHTDYTQAKTLEEKVAAINISLQAQNINFKLPLSYAKDINTIIRDTQMLENGIYNAYLLSVKDAVDDLIIYCKKYQVETLEQVSSKMAHVRSEYNNILKLEMAGENEKARTAAIDLLIGCGHIRMTLEDKSLENLSVFITFELDSLQCIQDIRQKKPVGDININEIRDSIAQVFIKESVLPRFEKLIS